MEIADEIMQLASRYLNKVGRCGTSNIKAICPFHSKEDGSPERTPSFSMSLLTGQFLCHSCHAKGNLYTFLRDIGEGRRTLDSYRELIDTASSNIPAPLDPLRPETLALVPESVLGLFDVCPTALLNAGFTQQTLYHFDVGYDRWHLRTTYPLRDLNGRLVGISGRANGELKPRYKVYTNEYQIWGLPPIAHLAKGSILWNADKVYPSVFPSDPGKGKVVVVEGFKACMWLWQAGIKNTVALLGTYLTQTHRWVLERLGADVYLFLDNDAAGRAGTIQTADTLSSCLPTYVVSYPKRLINTKAQPDSCTVDELEQAINNAPPYLLWLINHMNK